MNFPPHKCGLFLTHNEHRNYYQPLAEWLFEHPQQQLSWPSDEARQRALSTDECWVLQWYPDTPIGFYRVAAPSLEECLEFAATLADETSTSTKP